MTDTEEPAVSETPAVATGPIPSSNRRTVLISAMIFVALAGALVALVITQRRASQPTADKPITSSAGWVSSETDSATAENRSPDETSTGETVATETDSAPTVDDTDITPGGPTRTGVVKRGVPVVKNLTGLGLSMADAQLIINAMDGVYDFRRSQPGHKFEVQFNEATRQPVRFRYEVSITEIYSVSKNGDTWEARQLKIITQKTPRTFAGTITRSLYGTFSDIGASAALAGQLADILSTQVNFLKEQRPGDTFRIIVEEESLNGQFLGFGPILALEYTGVKSGKRRLYRFAAGDDVATYYDEKGISVPSSIIAIPLHYSRMSSPFGWRIHPVLRYKKLHNGVDFSAPTGTPVWACAEGVITIFGNKGANGNLVGINHGDGLESYYAHLSRFAAGIKIGTKVKRKQVIGYVGSTGRSTGPHLHWGVKVKGKMVDPLKYKIRPGTPPPARYRAELKSFIARQSEALARIAIPAPKEALASVDDANEEPMGVTEDF